MTSQDSAEYTAQHARTETNHCQHNSHHYTRTWITMNWQAAARITRLRHKWSFRSQKGVQKIHADCHQYSYSKHPQQTMHNWYMPRGRRQYPSTMQKQQQQQAARPTSQKMPESKMMKSKKLQRQRKSRQKKKLRATKPTATENIKSATTSPPTKSQISQNGQ